jgi:hypothetical protein
MFFRVVRTNPPSLLDFMSNEALGRRPRRPLSERDHDRWRGVSHFDSAELASSAANASPWLGQFVAAVEIPLGAAVRVEQTYRAGHWTIWGDPADLLALVVSVAPA